MKTIKRQNDLSDRWSRKHNLRVMHLLVSTNHGGIARFVHDLMKSLSTCGYGFIVAYGIRSEGMRWYMSMLADDMVFCPMRYNYDSAFSYRLSKIIRNSAQWLFIAHLIAVLRRHHPDVVHSHIHGSHWLSQLLAARIGKVPIAFHLHSPTSPYPQNKIRAWLWAKLLRPCDRVVIISNGVQEAYRRVLKDVLNENVVVRMPQGILPPVSQENTVEVHSRILRKKYPGIKILGAVSRLVEEKRFEDLITAAADLIAAGYNIGILLVGDGNVRSRIEEKARRCGVKHRLHITGYVDEPFTWLSEIDVYVLPSLFEGLPISIVEAMCGGLPIVASNVVGIQDLIVDESNGLLYEVGDTAGMTMQILRVLQDKKLAQRLACNARTVYEANHDMNVISRAYGNMYYDMLTNRGSAVAGGIPVKASVLAERRGTHHHG